MENELSMVSSDSVHSHTQKQKQQEEQQSKWYNFLARTNEFLIYITTKKKNKNEI